MVKITEHPYVLSGELKFTASKSSGPGGQNVNKVSSRVTLSFDVISSPSLSPEQKGLVFERLYKRIGRNGVLRVMSQQTRSQVANRELAIMRFVELLQDALKEAPTRKEMRVSRAEKLRRLAEKRRRSLLKGERSKRTLQED